MCIINNLWEEFGFASNDLACQVWKGTLISSFCFLRPSRLSCQIVLGFTFPIRKPKILMDWFCQFIEGRRSFVREEPTIMPCVFSMFNFNPVASENLCMISRARQTEGLPNSVRVKSSA